MAFTVQLVQRLREQDPDVDTGARMARRAAVRLGTSPDELVRREHQHQAAMNVTVRNVITSMRTMSTFDWAEFFESVSLVDDALRADSTSAPWTSRPATGTVTRSRTSPEVPGGPSSTSPGRRSPERTAPRRSGNRRAPGGSRAEDPGYYLISKGRPLLRTGDRLPDAPHAVAAARLRLAAPRRATSGTIGVIAAMLVALPLLAAHAAGMSPVALVLLGLARPDSGLRSRRRAHQPFRHGAARPASAAAPRARRRRPDGSADPRGDADAR